MFNNIYNFIYLLGLQTIRRLKKFGKRMKEVFLRPLRAVTTLIFTALIVIDKFALNTFHEITADVKSLFENTKRVLSEAKADNSSTKKIRIKNLPVYFRKMWQLYKHVVFPAKRFFRLSRLYLRGQPCFAAHNLYYYA